MLVRGASGLFALLWVVQRATVISPRMCQCENKVLVLQVLAAAVCLIFWFSCISGLFEVWVWGTKVQTREMPRSESRDYRQACLISSHMQRLSPRRKTSKSQVRDVLNFLSPPSSSILLAASPGRASLTTSFIAGLSAG